MYVNWRSGQTGLAHNPCPHLADSRLHQAGPEQVNWNAALLMGLKSSRKLAGAGGEGGSETITAVVPLTFLGWGHSDFELLLCIWLAHWEPCKLRQTGDQVRKENPQVIYSHHCGLHYPTARSLERELRLPFSFKLLQPPEQCCPFCEWSTSPCWLSLFLHLWRELPRPT